MAQHSQTESLPSLRTKVPTRKMAVRIAAIYTLLGGLWIYGSGWLLHYLVRDSATAAFIETLKGWFFVAFTAILLGLALDRYFRTIRNSTRLLQASEERWKHALDGASQAVWDWNVSTGEVFYSAPWKPMLAIGPQYSGFSLSGWQSIIHDQDLPRVKDEVQRHLEGKTPAYRSEYRIRCRDGAYKWILDQGKIMSRSPEGKPLRVLGTHADISERKQAEQRIQESEARYRALFDQALDGIAIMTTDGRYLTVNESFARMHGYDKPRDMEGLRLEDVDVTRKVRPEPERMNRLLSGEGLTFEADHYRRDGTQFPLSVSCNAIRSDGDLWLLGFHRDVGKQKHAEEALRRSEERYRGLVETTFDWIWETDASGRYTYASPKVRDLLGYEPEEVLGQTPFDFMPEEEANRIRLIFRGIAAKREPFSALENINRHKSGHQVILETSGVPVLGPYGELLGYRGMDRDVSERKRLEAQIRQAQKLEAIGHLAGGVAHDFNNILAAIMMQLHLLRANPDLDEESRQGLRELDASARRAADLTRQLLMFSRRSVLSIRPLDINDVVANLLKMLGRLIGEHIELRFDSKSNLPCVEADAGMLEQVLMNLAVNARDAMPSGGRITISTSAVNLNADRSGAAGRPSGNFLCLSVSDTGCGMDDETLKRIFDPFFTTKEPGKGTGLGLATVHGIVAQHNGWVDVESAPGRGTTFCVFLPAATQPPPEVRTSVAEEPMKRGTETLLVVEDDAHVRRIVVQMLQTLGYKVYEAGTGRQAATLWPSIGPEVSLLLTDMVMPEGMTGLDLAEHLQSLKPGLKAIISSGYSSEMVHSGIPSRAGVRFLPKPYEAQLLANTVRECLDR